MVAAVVSRTVTAAVNTRLHRIKTGEDGWKFSRPFCLRAGRNIRICKQQKQFTKRNFRV